MPVERVRSYQYDGVADRTINAGGGVSIVVMSVTSNPSGVVSSASLAGAPMTQAWEHIEQYQTTTIYYLNYGIAGNVLLKLGGSGLGVYNYVTIFDRHIDIPYMDSDYEYENADSHITFGLEIPSSVAEEGGMAIGMGRATRGIPYWERHPDYYADWTLRHTVTGEDSRVICNSHSLISTGAAIPYRIRIRAGGTCLLAAYVDGDSGGAQRAGRIFMF